MYSNNATVNEEQVVSFLKGAVARVEGSSETDIQAFNQIKALYKKNVSLFRRNDVAAYLIREALNAGQGRPRFGRDKEHERSRERGEHQERYTRERPARYERPASPRGEARPSEAAGLERVERTERPPRVQIDPAVASTIFVGIGRNRRVYPRDLVGLLVSVAGLERDRIGDIRVLANYSFIQLFSEDCEKVISSLNGYDYRGRKLSVSYSKQRTEGDEGASSGGQAAQPPAAPEEEPIPATVSNESHGVTETSETAKLSEAQSVFAAQQAKASDEPPVSERQPYAETADDGQVKSHFGNGAAY